MSYRVVLTPKTLFAFISLLFICHELHELMHTAVAYFQCGCWGQRDFNVWNVCAACASLDNTLWITAAGPFISYLFVWIGWWLMSKRNTVAIQSTGFALVWANVPFARLFTVLMKGGDEGVLTRDFSGQRSISTTVWLIEISIILLLILPAFIRAWKLLQPQRRALVFIGFLIAPMLLEFITMHIGGNQLLKAGVLNRIGLLGSPLLVNLWNGIWALVLLLCFSGLTKLFKRQVVPIKRQK
jgi:hypothetical protein